MLERAQEIFEKYITEEAKRRFYVINCNLGNTNFGEVKETKTKLKIGMKKEEENNMLMTKQSKKQKGSNCT